MMRRFPAELTRHEEEPDLPGSILSPSQRERRAAGAPGSAGDEGGQEHMHGFNRELRLAERRRSSSGDGSARTPPPAITAISAVVLDDVDGDVLDASPNRVPGSPAQPSPQRLSIPRTPVSARMPPGERVPWGAFGEPRRGGLAPVQRAHARVDHSEGKVGGFGRGHPGASQRHVLLKSSEVK